MRLADIQKYAQLLARLYVLQNKLRTDPPKNVEEYKALVEEIRDLYEEARDLLSGDDVSPADIVAAHAMNQTVWADTKPPIVTPPPYGVFADYAKWITDPGDGPLKEPDYVYRRSANMPQDGLVFIWEDGPISLGGEGRPGPNDLLRIVRKEKP